MKAKHISVVLLIMLLPFLFACINRNKEIPNDTFIKEIVNYPNEHVTYSISKYSINDQCWVTYPQIRITNNEVTQKKVNDYFENTLIEIFELQEDLSDSIDGLNYTIECEVNLCNDKIISTAYYLVKTWDGSSMHYCDAFTINFDLNTGELFDPLEYYSIDEEFLNTIITKDNSKDRYGSPFKDQWENYLSISKVQASDIINHIYFSSDHIGISIPVDYSLLGEFCIEYEKVSSWLIEE